MESVDRIRQIVTFGTENAAKVVDEVKRIDASLAAAVKNTNMSTGAVVQHSNAMDDARKQYVFLENQVRKLNALENVSDKDKKKGTEVLREAQASALGVWRQQDRLLRGTVMTGEEYRRQLGMISKQEEIHGRSLPNEKLRLFNEYMGGGSRVTKKMKEETAQWNKQADEMNQHQGKGILQMAQWAVGWFVLYRAIRLVTGEFSSVITKTIELDKAMTELAAITGVSKDQANEQLKSIIEMGKAFGITTSEVVMGFQEWSRQGLNEPKKLQEAMNATLLLTNVAMLDVGTAVKYLTAVYYEYGLTTSQLVDITNKWVVLDMNHATTVRNLAEAYQVTGSAAKEFGVNIDELNALVTAATSITQRSGSEIGRSLRTIFTRLYRPETITDMYEIAHVSGIAVGGMKPLYSILKELSGQWKNLTEAQKAQISYSVAGVRQSAHLMALMGNWDEVETALKESMNARGDALLRNITIMSSYDKQIKALGPVMDEFRTTLGNMVMPTVITFLQSVGKHIGNLTNDIQKLNIMSDVQKVVEEKYGNLYVDAGRTKTISQLTNLSDQFEALRGLDELAIEKVYEELVAKKKIKEVNYDIYMDTLKHKVNEKETTEERVVNNYKLIKVLLDAAKAQQEKNYADTKGEVLTQLQADRLRENYDAYLQLGLQLKSSKILMDGINESTAINNQRIDDSATANKRRLGILEGIAPEMASHLIDLRKAQDSELNYRIALSQTTSEYQKQIANLPALQKQLTDQIKNKWNKTQGVYEARDSYKKYREEIDAAIATVEKTVDPERKMIAMKALLAEMTLKYGKSEEYAADQTLAAIDATMKNKGVITDYSNKLTKSADDQTAALRALQSQYKGLAQSVKGPFVDAMQSALHVYDLTSDGIKKTESAISILTKGLIDMGEKALSERLYNQINDLTGVFSGYGGMLANFQDPSSYYTFIVNAGRMVQNLWVEAFDYHITGIKNALSGSTTTGGFQGQSSNVIQQAINASINPTVAIMTNVAKSIAGAVTDIYNDMTYGTTDFIDKIGAWFTDMFTGQGMENFRTEPGTFGSMMDSISSAIRDNMEIAGDYLREVGQEWMDTTSGAGWDEPFSKMGDIIQTSAGWIVRGVGDSISWLGGVFDKLIMGVSRALYAFGGILETMALAQLQQQIADFEQKEIQKAIENNTGKANITQAKLGAYMGQIVGSQFGLGGGIIGALVGAAIGKQIGQEVDVPLQEASDSINKNLSSIKASIDISNKELSVVNRNLSAQRELPPAYGLREQYYFRPYEFGDGPFEASGGYSWGKSQQYAVKGSAGNNVTVGSIVINVPSGNPQEILQTLEDAFAMKSVSMYQGG